MRLNELENQLERIDATRKALLRIVIPGRGNDLLFAEAAGETRPARRLQATDHRLQITDRPGAGAGQAGKLDLQNAGCQAAGDA